MKKYVFMYLLAEDIDKVKQALGPHITYWKGMRFEHFQNGPFADKSGGMIIFSSSSLEQAHQIISADPLLEQQVIKKYWLKEWIT